MTVRGLMINRFSLDGIILDGNGNRVEGNFIGTDLSDTPDLGNGSDGVFLNSGSNNTIGGATPDKRNLISGNGANGIRFFDPGNQVLGNLIGTKKDGRTALGNFESGVAIIEGPNAVGGTTPGEANTIAFNGVRPPGLTDGVFVADARGGTGNNILRNAIFANGSGSEGLGIDLKGDGPTPNDGGTADDTDTGPNGLQNKPSLSSAITSGGTTTLRGVLDTKPNTTYALQFFAQLNGNEGRTFIGQKQIQTDSDGKVAFSFSPANAVAVGQKITVTATGPEGTSEFSAPREVTDS